MDNPIICAFCNDEAVTKLKDGEEIMKNIIEILRAEIAALTAEIKELKEAARKIGPYMPDAGEVVLMWDDDPSEPSIQIFSYFDEDSGEFPWYDSNETEWKTVGPLPVQQKCNAYRDALNYIRGESNESSIVDYAYRIVGEWEENDDD